MSTILDKIALSTQARIAGEKQQLNPKNLGMLAREALTADGVGPRARFEAALRGDDISFICEVKKASPSKGVIAPDFPYLQIAQEYEQAGAAAISVLTEPEFFQGSLDYLYQIAHLVATPVLRKDFIIDVYQLHQARVAGANAALLIAALLGSNLKEFVSQTHALGMAALVEVHDERELELALTAGAQIIGVNNRDLRTFEVDTSLSIRLRERVPPEILFVSESGISTPEDVRKLRDAGVNAVLIGETLMRSPNKAAMLANLRGGSPNAEAFDPSGVHER
ncbi:MAG: indole-3-glycerol phosphate synthase TrpC [Propionibacteriaceae bacterium]|jgi:indole-3-glycerol phosphate synthase|nr:indole-3-glycerol phosphate synthase TrpC [Propionibacteriaceae bacterium]